MPQFVANLSHGSFKRGEVIVAGATEVEGFVAKGVLRPVDSVLGSKVKKVEPVFVEPAVAADPELVVEPVVEQVDVPVDNDRKKGKFNG